MNNLNKYCTLLIIERHEESMLNTPNSGDVPQIHTYVLYQWHPNTITKTDVIYRYKLNCHQILFLIVLQYIMPSVIHQTRLGNSFQFEKKCYAIETHT